LVTAFLLCWLPVVASSETLSERILEDPRLNIVADRARALLQTGFAAGEAYPSQVFIRDYNTFLLGSCEVLPAGDLRAHLLPFLLMQEQSGRVPTYYDERGGAPLRTSQNGARLITADNESSFVQAISKYVACTHDESFLQERVNRVSVLDHMSAALKYLEHSAMDRRYGLITAATVIDWGDVDQEMSGSGTVTTATNISAAIYPNAMFIIALNDYMALLPRSGVNAQYWLNLRNRLKRGIAHYLWDARRMKFKPHAYVTVSPFPQSFDENELLFEGGTAVAIEAGLISNAELPAVDAQILEAQKSSNALAIAGSVYPPYPAGFYNNGMLCPFCYQNGALWPWFGGRMIKQLSDHGLLLQAYSELSPILDMVISGQGFFEYYTLAGEPRGSADYRGTAGAVLSAIESVQNQARALRTLPAAPFSYVNLPPEYNWHVERDRYGNVVLYGVAPADAPPPLRAGDHVYVGPDSNFFFFRHPPPITSTDLINRWSP